MYTVWHFGSDHGALLILIDCKSVPYKLKKFLGDNLEQQSKYIFQATFYTQFLNVDFWIAHVYADNTLTFSHIIGSKKFTKYIWISLIL